MIRWLMRLLILSLVLSPSVSAKDLSDRSNNFTIKAPTGWKLSTIKPSEVHPNYTSDSTMARADSPDGTAFFAVQVFGAEKDWRQSELEWARYLGKVERSQNAKVSGLPAIRSVIVPAAPRPKFERIMIEGQGTDKLRFLIHYQAKGDDDFDKYHELFEKALKTFHTTR